MSREEAIELLDNLVGMVSDNHDSDYDTALKMAIMALSQEPCDAISRQAVLKLMDKYSAASVRQFGRPITGIASMRTDVRDLPSVTQKSGEWLDKKYYYECSQCGLRSYLGDSNFCPNCGAKMESEENNG